MIHGFRGRPRLKESLAKREPELQIQEDTLSTKRVQHERMAQDDLSFHKSQLVAAKSSLVRNDTGPKTNETEENEHPEESHLNKQSVIKNTKDESKKFDVFEEFQNFQNLFPSFVSEDMFPSFINNLKDFPQTRISDNNGVIEGANQSSALSYLEENMMLKHFFKKLLPLLDAHPSSPWPQLALKYCDFEVAKSCFIALSCIHLYETKGAQEFYGTGMVHINNTMEYLIDYLKSLTDDGTLNVANIVTNLKKQSLEKQRSNAFVILLLIHVHLLFSVLESGRSALVRLFFQLSSSIVEDLTFRKYLESIDESSTLIVNFAWFDTISAVVSPDARLPYCDESWYGGKNDPVSIASLIGCPGEVFKCISRFCRLRKKLKESKGFITPDISAQFEEIRFDLVNYRNYVAYNETNSPEEIEYKIKCAQCWTIAVLMNLHRLIEPQRTDIKNLFIDEFMHVYKSMESTSPYVTQMVWPVFTFACVCTTEHQRSIFKTFIDVLYRNAKMGTITTMGAVAQECWSANKSWEEILASKEWLGSGIDFLVV